MNMKGDLKVETNVKKKNFVSVVLGLLFAVAMILMPAAKVSAEDLPEAVKYVDVTVGTDGKLTTVTKSIKDYTVVSAPGRHGQVAGMWLIRRLKLILISSLQEMSN